MRGLSFLQGSNACLLHWQAGSLPLSHLGRPLLYLGPFKSPHLLLPDFSVSWPSAETRLPPFSALYLLLHSDMVSEHRGFLARCPRQTTGLGQDRGGCARGEPCVCGGSGPLRAGGGPRHELEVSEAGGVTLQRRGGLKALVWCVNQSCVLVTGGPSGTLPRQAHSGLRAGPSGGARPALGSAASDGEVGAPSSGRTEPFLCSGLEPGDLTPPLRTPGCFQQVQASESWSTARGSAVVSVRSRLGRAGGSGPPVGTW